jgi:phosphoribosylaminoimidazolecarboxamide formyltransferase/IMP cyclohydrolase
MPDLKIDPPVEYRSVNRGIAQARNHFGDPPQTEWKVISERQPTDAEWASLKFAMKACQHVKSNAIVFVQGEATVALAVGSPTG